MECTLIKSDKQLVRVDMDEAWVDMLEVSVSGDEFLGFDLESHGQGVPIKVTIHYTELSQLTIKDASCKGEIVMDSLTHLYVISGSQLDASMDTKYCNLLMQSGSEVKLGGYCTSLKSQSESGSMLTADKLFVEDCIAAVESGASSKLNVSKTLTATAKSGGNISYVGSPEMKGLEAQSGGTVKKIEEGTAL